MAKSNRGLPSDFTLDIPDRPKPVDLGDYLDEVDAAPRPAPKPKPEAQPPQPAPSPAPADRNSDRGNVVEMRRSASEAPAEQDEEPRGPAEEAAHAEASAQAADQHEPRNSAHGR